MKTKFTSIICLMLCIKGYTLNDTNPYRERLQERHPQRTHLINYLISKNNYKTYLEIGIATGRNFADIIAPHKVGVDPDPETPATHVMTSDEFFAQNTKTFDCVFIDGLHLSEQCLRDIENSLNCLSPNGTIVAHDCLPKKYAHALRNRKPREWNGDVWRAIAYIRMTRPDVHVSVLNMDYGCGVFHKAKTPQQLYSPKLSLEEMPWSLYTENRNQLLNVIKVQDWLRKN